MLTLISVPKAFSGHTGIIQNNAIGSWARLDSDCEVILFGDDPGVADAANRHGVAHVPRIACTPKGTPILKDVLERADAIARHPFLCFVNADIILLPDVLSALRRVAAHYRRFLIVSSRFDCGIKQPLTFSAGWDGELRQRVRADGRMYPAGGSDIFIYPRALLAPIPPFAIGRAYWDNWLMYRAASNGARLVDATAMVTAVHQDHNYSHIRDIPDHADLPAPYLASEEARLNLALAGGARRLYTNYDATHVLRDDGELVSTWHPFLIRRRLKASIRRAATTAGMSLPAPLRRIAKFF